MIPVVVCTVKRLTPVYAWVADSVAVHAYFATGCNNDCYNLGDSCIVDGDKHYWSIPSAVLAMHFCWWWWWWVLVLVRMNGDDATVVPAANNTTWFYYDDDCWSVKSIPYFST